MTDADGLRAADSDDEPADHVTLDVHVTAHASAPGRTVFVEAGNTDAWIASSLTLDPSP